VAGGIVTAFGDTGNVANFPVDTPAVAVFGMRELGAASADANLARSPSNAQQAIGKI